MDALLVLSSRWRERANELRQWAAAEGPARALEECSGELEEAVREAQHELLGPGAAAEATGYSRRRLRELEAAGKLRNYGRKGAPLFRRSELPHKPQTKAKGDYDAASDAARLLDRMGST